MSAALFKRTFRNYLLLNAGASALLFAFVILFMFASNSIPLEESRQWLKLEWVRRLINAMIGGDVADALTPTGVSSFVFTHPFTWVLIVSYLLTTSTGVLSAEMDRGTMDLLATLPISRKRLYVSVSAVVLVMGLPIVWSAWLGVFVGARLVGVAEHANMSRLAMVVVNLYAAYVCMAGFALAVSGSSERRGVALVWCFLIFFYSFILNLLAAFWPAAQEISFTGFLYYYAPLPMVLNGEWPTKNLLVLVGVGMLTWGVGALRFCRRDIHVT